MNQAQVDAEALFSAGLALNGGGTDAAARALGIVRDGDSGAMRIEDLAGRLAEAIAGEPAAVLRCRKLVADTHPDGYACDEVALALLRHARVPIEVAAAIGVMTRELDVDAVHFEVTTPEGRAVGVQVEGQAAGMRVEADLAPDRTVMWHKPIVVLTDPLPETIMEAAAGRPLSSVLSHPALDGMGLMIETAWRGKKGETTLALAPVGSIDVVPDMRTAA